MAKILKCPGCDREIRTSKTRDLNKHINLNGNLRKGQCLPALRLMQNPVPAPVGNLAENPVKNPAPTPEGNLISFDKNPLSYQPAQLREENVPAVDLLTDDIPDIKAGPNSEPSDDVEHRSSASSEYDTADEDPDIYFEKINDPYINRISEAENFNEGEVCDYYAFVPKGYYAESEPLAFFESIEEKIADVYRRELTLKGGLKHETIEIIREDRINASIEKGYNEIIDQIEDEAIQESGWAFVRAVEPQLGLINPQNFKDNECFRDCVNIHHAREDALKAGQKPTHLERISKIRRYGNIANFEGINFPATLHDIDKFEENNPNYAINIFRPVYKEVFRKIKVDIDLLHISERNYQVEHMIDLLYLTEGEENLNDRKNTNDIPEGLKTRLDLLEKHIPTCTGASKEPQRLILPEE
ncbi:3025_t:CDS:2, partial [Dentiscutata heterogama]